MLLHLLIPDSCRHPHCALFIPGMFFYLIASSFNPNSFKTAIKFIHNCAWVKYSLPGKLRRIYVVNQLSVYLDVSEHQEMHWVGVGFMNERKRPCTMPAIHSQGGLEVIVRAFGGKTASWVEALPAALQLCGYQLVDVSSAIELFLGFIFFCLQHERERKWEFAYPHLSLRSLRNQEASFIYF